MSFRDDNGSGYGTGQNGFGGGGYNGGIGGGMGGGNGGSQGGGAGRNGGYGAQYGLQTGTRMNGTSAYGRPGGMAMGWGMTPAAARANAMQPRPTGGVLQNIQNMQRPAMPPAVPQMPAPPAQPYNPLASIQPPPRPPSWSYGMWQRNPTSYPQYARDWEKGQWAENSTYGGMAPGQNDGPHWGATQSAPNGAGGFSNQVGNKVGGGGGY